MISFSGRTALITGAASGQGASESQLFAALGAHVVLADIDFEGARAMAGRLGPERALAVQLDVSREDSWHQALRVVQLAVGRVDVLINNAGIFRPTPILDAATADINALISVNQLGTYLGIRVIGRHMRESGGGAIVNVASVAALKPNEGATLYGMTKAAIVNLTKGAALELGPDIRVNCVLPGAVDTPMLGSEGRALLQNIPLRRVGQSDEISRAVAFFASDASSYCTGATLVVDGGWTLGLSKDNIRRLAQS